MATLLILGSKPDPRLPPRGAFDAIACANASGRSAATLGLSDPVFTVISAIVTSGRKPANDLAVENLAGLATEDLYFLPRPHRGRRGLGRAVVRMKMWRTSPSYFRVRLRRAGYRWERFVNPGYDYYDGLVRDLSGDDPAVSTLVSRKQPSTGAFALAVALSLQRWDRIVLSGFSFELTHAYAWNPMIDEIGATRSKHAETDIAVMRALARKSGSVYTTEPVVMKATGIEPLPAVAMPGGRHVAALDR